MKSFALTCLIVLVPMLVGVSLWWTWPTSESLQAKRVTIAAIQLPVGSTRNQVASLLKKEGLEASYIGGKDNLEFESAVRDSGYKPKELSGFYVAIIRNTSRTVIGECYTHYFFFFGKKGELLKATSESGCIGL